MSEPTVAMLQKIQRRDILLTFGICPLTFLGLDEFLVTSSNQVKAAEQWQLREVQLTPLPQAPRPWLVTEQHRAEAAQGSKKDWT